jgi:anti-sigma factor RsiW
MNRRGHVQHLFSSYIDGDLSPARTRAVEAHLAECSACAGELAQWRAVLRLVSSHAAVTCPIDCAEAVLHRLRTQPARRHVAPPAPAWRALIPALALILTFLGGGTWLWSTRDSSHSAPGRLAATAPVRTGAGAGSSPLGAPIPGAEEAISPARGMLPVTPDAARLAPAMAVPVHAPARLEEAFGRSDSLILAADFAEDDR